MARTGDVDADDAAAALEVMDRFAGDDLVLFDGEGAVHHDDQPSAHHRVFELGSLHAANSTGDDVVEVALAATIPLHGIEAQLHGGDVALAIPAADDLVDAALDGLGTGLDQLRPVEQLGVVVQALDASVMG